MNPGYVMLSLLGLDLTETDPQSISGSYVKTGVAAASGKPVWLYGVDGYGPIPASISLGESATYIVNFLHYTATVASGGSVTVADLIS